MMRAILIDPFTQTIEEVEYSGDYKDIYALIQWLPVNTARHSVAASAVIYAGVDDNNLSFSGLNLALANPNTDLRIFGKPEGFTRRRMGVATARAETTDQARELAVQAAGLVSVHQN